MTISVILDYRRTAHTELGNMFTFEVYLSVTVQVDVPQDVLQVSVSHLRESFKQKV